MKRPILRPILFTCLIIASLSAFVYVNFGAADTSLQSATPAQEQQVAAQTVETQEENSLDVQILKTLVEKALGHLTPQKF